MQTKTSRYTPRRYPLHTATSRYEFGDEQRLVAVRLRIAPSYPPLTLSLRAGRRVSSLHGGTERARGVCEGADGAQGRRRLQGQCEAPAE